MIIRAGTDHGHGVGATLTLSLFQGQTIKSDLAIESDVYPTCVPGSQHMIFTYSILKDYKGPSGPYIGVLSINKATRMLSWRWLCPSPSRPFSAFMSASSVDPANRSRRKSFRLDASGRIRFPGTPRRI